MDKEEILPDLSASSQTSLPQKNRALVIAGSPLWIPLVIGAVAVVFSLWIALWSVAVSLWAAFVAACGGLIGALGGSIRLLTDGSMAQGVCMIACGFLCIGGAILLFFAARGSTKGMVRLTKKLFKGCKAVFFVKKEVAQ